MVAATGITAGTGSPAPLMPVSCRFRLDLEKWSRMHSCNQVGVTVGMVYNFLVLSGEATLLHSSGVIACACSEL